MLGPPYRVLVDTNFINFSIKGKLDPDKAMMDCLYVKCTSCITDCVIAELEKLGTKYRVALRIAKNPSFERIQCVHKGRFFCIKLPGSATGVELSICQRFKCICKKSMIKKHYMHLTEEIMTKHPNLCLFEENSLGICQDIMVEEVPKLGAEAARRAIKELGQDVSKITHVVFCTTAGVDMLGADHALITLLDLSPSINRVMLYHQGYHAGGTVLRVAKDLAENNKGSRVLVDNSELTVTTFRGPHKDHEDSLVDQAFFADEASSLIIGSDPDPSIERPLFQLVTAVETILPGSRGAIVVHLCEVGLTFHLLDKSTRIDF